MAETAPPDLQTEVDAVVEAFLAFLGGFEEIGYDSSQAANPEFQEVAAALFTAGGPTVDAWVNENCDTTGFFGGELVPPP